jgi:hypothetical protein
MAANARNPGRYNVNALYATGVDLARQTDYTVITTLDIRTRPAKVVYYRRLNRVPWESIYREVGRAAAMWGGNILADKTGMGGDVVMDALESRFYCPEHDRTFLSDNPRCPGAVDCNGNHWLPLSCVEGYEFSGQRKKQLIESLRNSMSIGYVANSDLPFGWLRSPPIVQLEEELAFYIWEDKNLETDCLFSLALCVWHGLQQRVLDAVSGSRVRQVVSSYTSCRILLWACSTTVTRSPRPCATASSTSRSSSRSLRVAEGAAPLPVQVQYREENERSRDVDQQQVVQGWSSEDYGKPPGHAPASCREGTRSASRSGWR